MRATEELLITVRTYPTPSRQYLETVCTGAINFDHRWRRLYPVPLRYLNDDIQFRKWHVISVALEKRGSDTRPETRRPDTQTIRVLRRIDDLQERWDWVNPTAMDSFTQMKQSGRTLCAIRVANVISFDFEKDEEDWSERQMQGFKQEQLFEQPKRLEKIPVKFFLRWRDANGEEFRSRFIDWEAGETWRSYRSRYPGEVEARMRDEFLKRFEQSGRLFFFMGNYAKRRQHFAVCGYFAPSRGKIDESPPLFA